MKKTIYACVAECGGIEVLKICSSKKFDRAYSLACDIADNLQNVCLYRDTYTAGGYKLEALMQLGVLCSMLPRIKGTQTERLHIMQNFITKTIEKGQEPNWQYFHETILDFVECEYFSKEYIGYKKGV